MRLLLDECVDQQLRHHFKGHECQTVRYAGLAGLENGELLRAAEAATFDVLLTVDRGFEYQQKLGESEDCGHYFLWEIRSSGRSCSVNTDLH